LNLSLTTVLSTLFGALVGAVVTWLTARHYYRKAANDLRDEAERFQMIIGGTFESFEQSGWVRIARDGNGRIIRMTPRLTFGASPRPTDEDP
jgi:hypothetical protein